ncbi:MULTISPECIES: rhamnulokinase [Clostridium]|uniref:Rhamnulokinase n=2 Tax=Clostridium TaxID=1485 RepID=A0A151AM17_9CLOT|nr:MULTISPECIES: rhamnulokinase [Clostridium]KYH28447.1 rhamnulokinase [Clostridium colicanis DSM 13634]PRR75717.1 Rhamnulokinase [Clostridium thermopalmarium DSM 5974]PVZ26596.1 rhamnulokinase [Clostridium thermopalmarium DSM 5974]
MSKVCIAIDIGASSGRLIVGTMKEEKIIIKEVYRFKNNMLKKNGSYYWDMDKLFKEIMNGLKEFAKEGINVESIGIDTWAVDYALLNRKNEMISQVYAYRDHRTDRTMEKVFKEKSPEAIYEKTGIQFQQFNTIYQLYEHVRANKEIVNNVDVFLMVPDYLNYLLSGKKAVEFTNATTTQLFNINNLDWDEDLISIVGLSKDIFPRVIKSGTILGELRKEVQEETGLGQVKIIAPATHDTGSAVASIPATTKDFAYISSGTWSLMGIESDTPICTEEARVFNFTNEGGVFNTYRVLKNIMGLWLIQEVQKLYDYKYSFEELVTLAEECKPFRSLINPNNSRFLNPKNMIKEIKNYCRESKQAVPETPGEIARCIYESLAFQYKNTLLEIKKISSKPINKIHIIGGGVQNKFLNQLCANFTNCEVYAGPVEATALGNLAMQFITLGEISSLKEARRIISESFNIKKYIPIYSSDIEENWERFKSLQ